MQGNSGNDRDSSQDQIPSWFVFLSSSAQLIWEVQDSTGKGHGPESLGLTFWDPTLRMNLAVGFQLSLLFYFNSEPGNLPGPSPNLGPNLQKLCSHRLLCLGSADDFSWTFSVAFHVDQSPVQFLQLLPTDIQSLLNRDHATTLQKFLKKMLFYDWYILCYPIW